MTIGFDIDGVLAAFIPAYQRLTIEATGRNLFHPGDDTNPPIWNWPEYRGYSADEMKAVWSTIKNDATFWVGLRALTGATTLRLILPDLLRRHDIYYITARPGVEVKWQTELWLQLQLEHELPTVLISSAKGLCAKALTLDVYIDDNFDNAVDVAMTSPDTRTYLLNTSYNILGDVTAYPSITRVSSVGAMFDRELANL